MPAIKKKKAVTRHAIKLARPAKGRTKAIQRTTALRPASTRRSTPVGVSAPPPESQANVVRLTSDDLRTIARMIGGLSAAEHPQLNKPHQPEASEAFRAHGIGDLLEKTPTLRRAPIMQAIDNLFDAVNGAENLLANLADKLSPVLGCPLLQETATGVAAGLPGSSDLMHRLQHAAERVQGHNNRLAELLLRTELPEPCHATETLGACAAGSKR